MGIFDIFKRKKAQPPSILPKPKIERGALCEEIIGKRDMTDYLGKAVMCEKKGLAEIKEQKFNQAWKSFHEQKQHYMEHANRSEFTPHQALALDASVSVNLANILRLESKHLDAFIHILYWVSTSQSKTKAQEQKLKAYFNRAKTEGLSFNKVNEFIGSQGKKDLKTIQTWFTKHQTNRIE